MSTILLLSGKRLTQTFLPKKVKTMSLTTKRSVSRVLVDTGYAFLTKAHMVNFGVELAKELEVYVVRAGERLLLCAQRRYNDIKIMFNDIEIITDYSEFAHDKNVELLKGANKPACMKALEAAVVATEGVSSYYIGNVSCDGKLDNRTHIIQVNGTKVASFGADEYNKAMACKIGKIISAVRLSRGDDAINLLTQCTFETSAA